MKVLLLAGLALGMASAQTAAPAPGGLDQRIQAGIGSFPGQVSIYAKNLESGASYSLRGDDPVSTASTIKLPIMVELFSEAGEGKLDWNQKLELTDAVKVPGSGILNEFSPGDTFAIRDLMHVMIVMSDNTATNMILDRIGGDAVNHRMAQLGLKQTAVMREIMRAKNITEEGRKPDSERWGLGRSSPHDMVMLIEKMYRGQLVNKEASDEMLTVLKRQRDLQGVGRDTPDTVVASKSGALDHLRSEVALVYSQHGPIAMAITVTGIPKVDYGVDNAGNLLIAHLGEIVVDGLAGPGPPAAPQMKP
jgi:beta-lactamase class A